MTLATSLMINKHVYHIFLHRQHRRLKAGGITLSRSSLLSWQQRVLQLLEPNYREQIALVVSGNLIAMKETDVPVGRKSSSGQTGKM